MKIANQLYLATLCLMLATALIIDFRTLSMLVGVFCLLIGLFYLIEVDKKIVFYINRVHHLEEDFIMANKIIANLEEQKRLLEKQKGLQISLLKTQESLLSDNQKIINKQDEIIDSYKLMFQTEQEKLITDKKLTTEFIQLQHKL